MAYLGTRNIAIFSTDIDSFDFKIRTNDGVVKSVMDKLFTVEDLPAAIARLSTRLWTKLKTNT